MSENPTRVKSKFNEEIGKPLDGRDLLSLGYTVDYFYRRYVEIGRTGCPRCGHHHLSQTRRKLVKNTGWEWTCMNCAQRWRTPNITPLMTQQPMKISVSEITDHKYTSQCNADT